ncbi:hypothetical protein CC79DRAFT_675406 [Sarocladium strictum]
MDSFLSSDSVFNLISRLALLSLQGQHFVQCIAAHRSAAQGVKAAQCGFDVPLFSSHSPSINHCLSLNPPLFSPLPRPLTRLPTPPHELPRKYRRRKLSADVYLTDTRSCLAPPCSTASASLHSVVVCTLEQPLPIHWRWCNGPDRQTAGSNSPRLATESCRLGSSWRKGGLPRGPLMLWPPDRFVLSCRVLLFLGWSSLACPALVCCCLLCPKSLPLLSPPTFRLPPATFARLFSLPSSHHRLDLGFTSFYLPISLFNVDRRVPSHRP